MEYGLRDIIPVFIWELPMKVDTIDTFNDIMIIRDKNSTKKIRMSLVLEYFSQNSKIEQLEDTIENALQRIDNEYIPKYEYIIKELNFCDNLINGNNGLKERFDSNRLQINALILTMAQCGVSINSLEKEINKLAGNIRIIEEKITKSVYLIQDIEKRKEVLFNAISKTEEIADQFIESTNSIESSWKSIEDYLQEFSEDINTDIANKIDTIKQKLNYEYDLILSIIDRYHHVHDLINKGGEII